MMVSVFVVIGMLVDPFVGLGLVIVGGLFTGVFCVVNVYVLFVQVFPSFTLTYHV